MKDATAAKPIDPIMMMMTTIPARFHHIFEPFLEFDFEVEVQDLGTYIHLILTGRQYQNLNLLDVNVELAKERRLEILLKAIESPKLMKNDQIIGGPSTPFRFNAEPHETPRLR